MKFKYCLFLSVLPLLPIALSCDRLARNGNDDTETIKSVAEDFSDSYFNYRFDKAMKYCTNDEKKAISYIATNITEDDIRMLRDKEDAATCETGDITLVNDSCADVECTVNDYYAKSIIGKAGEIRQKSEYTLRLVRENNRWLVRKVAPLQSGRPSHD